MEEAIKAYVSTGRFHYEGRYAELYFEEFLLYFVETGEIGRKRINGLPVKLFLQQNPGYVSPQTRAKILAALGK